MAKDLISELVIAPETAADEAAEQLLGRTLPRQDSLAKKGACRAIQSQVVSSGIVRSIPRTPRISALYLISATWNAIR